MVMSSTFVVLSKLFELPLSIGHGCRIAKLTMVRLLETCLSSIAQIEMPLNLLSTTKVLLITMALSFGIDDYIEGGVITAVILLNSLWSDCWKPALAVSPR
jgi:hypothetical protein